jgi:hypothetical protein
MPCRDVKGIVSNSKPSFGVRVFAIQTFLGKRLRASDRTFAWMKAASAHDEMLLADDRANAG